jgi:hypothetical protein
VLQPRDLVVKPLTHLGGQAALQKQRQRRAHRLPPLAQRGELRISQTQRQPSHAPADRKGSKREWYRSFPVSKREGRPSPAQAGCCGVVPALSRAAAALAHLARAMPACRTLSLMSSMTLQATRGGEGGRGGGGAVVDGLGDAKYETLLHAKCTFVKHTGKCGLVYAGSPGRLLHRRGPQMPQHPGGQPSPLALPTLPRPVSTHLSVMLHSCSKWGRSCGQRRPCRRSAVAAAAASRTRHWLPPMSARSAFMMAASVGGAGAGRWGVVGVEKRGCGC